MRLVFATKRPGCDSGDSDSDGDGDRDGGSGAVHDSEGEGCVRNMTEG